MKQRLLLALLLFFSSSLLLAEGVDQRKERLEEIRTQIKKKQQRLEQAEHQKRDIQEELKQAEKEISYIGRRLHIIRQDYELQETRWRELQGVKLVRQQALESAQQRLGELLRNVYRIDRHGDIRMILNQEDPALFSRMLTYHSYFSRQRIEQIERVQFRLDELAKAEHALALQSSALARLQHKREDELARLATMKQQKQLALDDIRRDIDSEGKQLSQLRKDERALKRILKSLTDLLSDIPGSVTNVKSFGQLKGQLPWPSGGKLTTRFGTARGDSGKRWSGVIIGTQRGDDVRAVARGRVAFSDWLRGYGLLLILDHGDGYMSLYGHNESVYKDTGEWVESGQGIASVGDSGGQHHTGLYFEIRRDGKPINPVKWCLNGKPPVRS